VADLVKQPQPRFELIKQHYPQVRNWGTLSSSGNGGSLTDEAAWMVVQEQRQAPWQGLVVWVGGCKWAGGSP